MVGAIEQVVYTQLKAILPAGVDVYLHEIPEEEHGSCVVLEAQLRSETGGDAPLYATEVRTAAYARQHGAAETLAGQVRTALIGFMYGSAGLRLGPLQLSQIEPGYESTWDQHRLTLVWDAQALLWAV